MEDDDWKRIKARAALKGKSLEKYIADIFKSILDKIDEPIYVQPKVAKEWTDGESLDGRTAADIAHESITGERLAEEPKYGLCEVCKKNGIIKPTTYLDDEQVRVTKELCLTCINKAKVSGVIRDD